MERVTVIVATFGSNEWEERGDLTAVLARARFDGNPRLDRVVHLHGRTLAAARNAGAWFGPWCSDAEWLCFLDADDELEPGYLDALLAGSGDLRAPSVRYDDGPALSLAARNIDIMNPCVIGTLIRRDMFIDAGGFWHERAWEDWSLFRRAWLLGAEIVHHPDAVYHVHTRPDSRNNTVRAARQLHDAIRTAHTAWKATR